MNRTDQVAVVLVMAGFVGCTCTKQTPPTPPPPTGVIELKIDDPKVPPVPLSGSDPRRETLRKLLDSSGVRVAATDEAEKSLREIIAVEGVAGVKPRAELSCRAAGCTAEVEYENLDAFLAFDRVRFLRPESAFHQWRGANGRTAPRLEGNTVVATWYALLPPDETRIGRFKESKGFAP